MDSFKLDPRTKIILLFLMGTAIFSYMPTFIVGIYIFIGYALLLMCKKYKSIVVYTFLYFIIRVIAYFAYTYDFLLLNLLKGFVNLFTLFFPIFVYGRYLILSTSISEFSLALEKLKTPLGIQIVLLVMFRFFPTIGVEYKSILNAMKLRDVSFSALSFIRHPVKTIEYIYVPLVYSLIKTGDELTVASLTRGLGLYTNRTYLTEIGFTYIDLFIIILFLGLMILGILIKGGVL